MTTRMVWSPHDHHRAFRGFLEAQRVLQADLMHINTGQTTNAQETTRKQGKQANPHVLAKWPKTEKRGNHHKNSEKKTAKEKQEAEQATEHAATIPYPEQKQTAGQKSRKLCETGICCHQKTCINKQCKIRNGEVGEKKQWKQTNNPNQKEQTIIYAYTLKASSANKQNKQTTVSYGNINMCFFFCNKNNKIATTLISR